MVEEADRLPLGADEDAADLRARGEALREEWRCEALGLPPPAAADLSTSCIEAHGAAERVIGAPLPLGCPLYCLRAESVHRVGRAYRWWDKSQLALVEGPDPPAALCDAIDAVAEAIAAREAADARRHAAEAEAARTSR